MAQKCLDHANIDILLEEVRGETVPQRVRRHAFLDPGGFGSSMDARLSWRVESGSTGLRPGNSQPRGSNTPRRRPSRHQARSISSSCGDSMACRSPTFARAGLYGALRCQVVFPPLSVAPGAARQVDRLQLFEIEFGDGL